LIFFWLSWAKQKITGLLNHALNGVLLWKNQLKYVDEIEGEEGSGQKVW
jgi:hypothetical protein